MDHKITDGSTLRIMKAYDINMVKGEVVECDWTAVLYHARLVFFAICRLS